jgi:hypothetical protein
VERVRDGLYAIWFAAGSAILAAGILVALATIGVLHVWG